MGDTNPWQVKRGLRLLWLEKTQDIFFRRLAEPSGAGPMAIVCQVRYINTIQGMNQDLLQN